MTIGYASPAGSEAPLTVLSGACVGPELLTGQEFRLHNPCTLLGVAVYWGMIRDGRTLDHKTLEEIRRMAVERVQEGEAPSRPRARRRMVLADAGVLARR